MNTNNKMSKIVYISLAFFINLFLAVLFFRFFYNEKLFRFEGFFSFMYIVCVFIGFILTYKKRRTIWSAIAIVSIPYGFYCFIAYPGTGSIVASVLLAISIGFVAADIFIKKYPRDSDKELITMIRVKKLIHRAHYLTAFFSLMLICIVLVSNIFLPNSQNSNSLEKQSDIRFSLDEWANADLNQRVAFAQQVVDFECEKMCIKPLSVVAKSKMPESRLGYYSDNNSLIVVNENHIKNDNMLEVLNTIAHECFHSAQYSLILNGENYSGDTDMETNISDRINTYKVEFEDYKSFNDVDVELNYKEFFNYYTQKCEVDARSYGDIEAIVLYKLIVSTN